MTHDKTIEELIEQPEHMPIAAMYREAIKAQHQELIKLREENRVLREALSNSALILAAEGIDDGGIATEALEKTGENE